MENIAQDRPRTEWTTRSLSALGLRLPCTGDDVRTAYLEAVRRHALSTGIAGSNAALARLHGAYRMALSLVEQPARAA